jgi:hypothetical protein
MYRKECRELLQEAVTTQLLENKSACKTHPRGLSTIVVGDSNGIAWQLLDNSWVPIAGREKQYALSSGCSSPEGLVVSGGFSSNAISVVTMYVTSINQWVKLPSLNHARYGHASVCFKHELYIACGRKSEASALNTIEKFTFGNSAWVNLSNIPENIYHPHLAIACGRLFLLAGRASHIYEFCEQSNTWMRKADMIGECLNGGCAVYNDKIYLIRGDWGKSMCYNPQLDQWSVITSPMSGVPRGVKQGMLLNDKIVVFGGNTTGANCADKIIEEYDAKLGRWSVWNLKTPKAVSFAYAVKMVKSS